MDNAFRIYDFGFGLKVLGTGRGGPWGGGGEGRGLITCPAHQGRAMWELLGSGRCV